MFKKKSVLFFLFISLFISPFLYGQRVNRDIFTPLADSLQKHFKPKAFVSGRIKIDSVFTYNTDILFYFSNSLAEYPFRENDVSYIYRVAKEIVPNEYKNLKIRVITNGSAIEELVPPIYNSTGSLSLVKT